MAEQRGRAAPLLKEDGDPYLVPTRDCEWRWGAEPADPWRGVCTNGMQSNASSLSP